MRLMRGSRFLLFRGWEVCVKIAGIVDFFIGYKKILNRFCFFRVKASIIFTGIGVFLCALIRRIALSNFYENISFIYYRIHSQL